MTATAIVPIVLGVLTLVSVVASAVAVARATLAKTTIETLKQSNEALTERVKLLEDENGRQKDRLTALQAENTALQGYVSGTDAVKELAAALLRSDQVRAAEHHDILAAVQTIPMVVTSAHQEIMAQLRQAS